MKKIISLLAAASMSALALVSCVKEEAKITGEAFTVNFLAQTPETKAIFGTPEGTAVPTLWEDGDNIAVICNFANDKKTAITTTDGKSASFSAEFTSIKEAESYTFYAAYPYVTSPYKSGKVKVSIPAVQTPVEGNVAKDAMGLVAKSEAFTAKPTEPVTLSFKHAAAYGCITKLGGVPETATISLIKITSDNNIVGTFLSDCESTTLTEDSASNILTINTNAHNNIWFSCAPFEGGKVNFEVITDDGTYVKETDFTGKKFEAGKIARFGLTGFTKSEAADVIYTLVKSVDELVEGANVIIAALDLDYDRATGAIGTNSYSSEVAISRNNDNNILNPGNDVMILTVENGASEGTYSLYSSKDEGYLCATTSGNNLKAQTNIDGFSSWNITISTEGSAIIKANGSNIASPFLRYNPGNTRFSCYKNTNDSNNNKNVAIYIDAKSVLPALGALTIEASKSGADAIEVIWTDVENATEYVVSCTGQTDQTVAAGVEYAKFEGLADGDYVVTVTAKAEGFKPATGSAETIHIGLLDRGLKFTDATKTLEVGSEDYTNVLTASSEAALAGVKYSSSNTDVADVDETSGLILAYSAGTTTITATAPATEEYKEETVSYTLTVVAEVLGVAYPYTESFAESKGKFTINDVTLPSGSTPVWQWASAQYGMKATAYISNKNYESESWLISPVIDMTSAENPVLTFDNVARYGESDHTTDLTLWAREKNGTWNQLTISNYGNGTTWNFVSNTIDLSAYAGKTLQIAFKYTSTSSAAATWEVKNVSIAEKSGETPVDPKPGENIESTFGSDWNTLFGTSYTGQFTPAKGDLNLSGEDKGVSIEVKNPNSTNGYIKTSDFRAYNGYTITITAPTGKNITAIATTKGGKTFSSGISANVGTGSISNNTYSWSGSSNSVVLTISGTVSFATITVTCE